MKKIIGIILLTFTLTVLMNAPSEAGQGTDFVLHAGVSFVVSTVSYNFYKHQLEMSDQNARIAAFATAMIVGVIKESIDDEFSGSDMGGNAVGAGLGVAVAFEF